MKTPTVRTISLRLAERIRQCRIAREWTQEELSSRADIALSTYKRFEQKGLISLDGLIKVSLALRVEADFDDLFVPDQSVTDFESLDEVEKAYAKTAKTATRVKKRG